jgi:hypothetical protein
MVPKGRKDCELPDFHYITKVKNVQQKNLYDISNSWKRLLQNSTADVIIDSNITIKSKTGYNKCRNK